MVRLLKGARIRPIRSTVDKGGMRSPNIFQGACHLRNSAASLLQHCCVRDPQCVLARMSWNVITCVVSVGLDCN